MVEKTSIIDIGTRSIKHFIFENKKQISFDRNSFINLGEGVNETNYLKEENINKSIDYIKNILQKDKDLSKTIILGTDALRKAKNSQDFINKVKKETNRDIKIISHQEEAELLGKAYKGLVKEDFAIINTGGGSTEVIVFKNNQPNYITIPLGVNKLHQEFLKKYYDKDDYNNLETWSKAKQFLKSEIDNEFSKYPNLQVNTLFLTGVLLFMLKQEKLMNVQFERSNLKEHPIKMSIKDYEKHTEILREIGVKRLAANYSHDPLYAINFAIGQTLYLTVAKKLNVKEVFPSEFQYIHGLLD